MEYQRTGGYDSTGVIRPSEMCDTENGPDLVKPLPIPIVSIYEDTDEKAVKSFRTTQGTQTSSNSSTSSKLKAKSLIQHHSSEYLNSPRNYNRRPFYTSRSGQPVLDPLSFPSYLASATRAKKKFLSYSTRTPTNDSPTSSLDCLTLKDINWNPDATVTSLGKVNGAFSLGALDVAAPSSVQSSKSCRCNCHCNGIKSINVAPPEPIPPEPQTTEGLSLRKLHMSRAKLKATSTTSELLSGFAMIAMVELQINDPTNVPEWLFVMFAVCTTILVAVHIFALMISTYLLPNIDAVSKMSAGEILRESPHERMKGFIELAWAFSTVLGLFLFLVEVAILCWVKFWDYSFIAAIAATVIVIPVLIVFVAFAVHFYHSLVVYKCEASTEDMEELENMKRNLDSTIKTNSPV